MELEVEGLTGAAQDYKKKTAGRLVQRNGYPSRTVADPSESMLERMSWLGLIKADAGAIGVNPGIIGLQRAAQD